MFHPLDGNELCFLSSPRRSWRALNGVATAPAAAGSTAQWSRPRPRTTRCCAASCAASRPTCSACGAVRSSPRPRSCGSSGGARSLTWPTSSIRSCKVRETGKCSLDFIAWRMIAGNVRAADKLFFTRQHWRLFSLFSVHPSFRAAERSSAPLVWDAQNWSLLCNMVLYLDLTYLQCVCFATAVFTRCFRSAGERAADHNGGCCSSHYLQYENVGVYVCACVCVCWRWWKLQRDVSLSEIATVSSIVPIYRSIFIISPRTCGEVRRIDWGGQRRKQQRDYIEVGLAEQQKESKNIDNGENFTPLLPVKVYVVWKSLPGAEEDLF